MLGSVVTRVLVGLALAAAAAPASGALLKATPQNLATIVNRAKSGDTIVLAPGHYGRLRLQDRTFNPPLTIEARGAVISGWRLNAVSGVNIRGGTWRNTCAEQRCFAKALSAHGGGDLVIEGAKVEGPPLLAASGSPVGAVGYGFDFADLRNVTVRNSTFSGFRVGILIGRVDGFHVVGNDFSRMSADGMNVSRSRNGVIERNTCHSFEAAPKSHPDCIQLWSRPDAPPTGDIVIRRNVVRGAMQGLTGFNHVRNGVNDGGFDRIVVEDNEVAVSYSQAIALGDSRESVIRNNVIRTLPGAKHRANINTRGSVGLIRCGNIIESGAGKRGVKDPRC